MKRSVYIVLTALCICALIAVPVSAQSSQDMLEDQWDASGISQTYDALPDQTKRLLSSLGVDTLSFEAMMSMEPQSALSSLMDALKRETEMPFTAVTIVLSGILVLGVYTVIQPAENDNSALFRSVGILVIVTPLFVPLWQTVQRVQAAADSASVFTLSFAPVYAGILTALGRPAGAASYQTVMLAAAQGIGALISAVMIPLLCMTLALGIVGAIHPAHRIGDVASMLNKTAVWLLSISMTVFVGMLSLQGIFSATADSVSGRILRFSVAGFVPVVGGSLSEALYTVKGCLGTLRGTAGGFGVLATVLTVLPTLAECVGWNVMLFVSKTAASMFGFENLSSVLQTVQGIIKTLIGVLSTCALLMIVSVTILTLTGGMAS